MTPSGSSRKVGWRGIWSNRIPDESSPDLLAALIKADGFDSGFSFYTPVDWLLMVEDAAERTHILPGSQVLEIGCGAGAFLYALHQLKGCPVSGVDYSPSLIHAARKHMPLGAFSAAEAINIPFEEARFDCVFSHGVFFYFPDVAYATKVLREAYRTLLPGGRLCLMDVNDKAQEADYLKVRRDMNVSPGEYEARYRGLPHLFYDKEELVDTLHQIGFRAIQFFDHRIATYGPARFRFNLIAAKFPAD